MGRRQLLLLGLATLVLLITVLWLADSLSRLYASLALISSTVANLFLWGVLALLLVGVGILIYYGWLFLRPRRARAVPRLPRDPVAVAETQRVALQRQLDEIQDEVAREALRERSQALTPDPAFRDLQVLVFGVGSAGKTSLINQLVGEPVGAVGAPMGTTTTRQTYPLRWEGMARQILLTDTPGISEAGVAGTLREQDARELATEADLILFVIDDDLRQSEYQILRSLLTMGKRLILVFNKADRYPEVELQAILSRVRSRFPGTLAPEDVLAIAAQPAPLPLQGGGWFHMDPDITPLVERMAEIIQGEGDTLIAENLLLQSQRLSEKARQLIDQQRQRQADGIVERYQWIGAGVIAAMPLPGLDLLAAAAVNAQMVVELGRVYGCQLSLEEGKALALSLAKTLTGLGIVRGATELLALGLQTNLATLLAGRALQGVSAAYLTRIAGKSFIEYFRQNQNWGDGGIGEVVQEQFRLNQREAFMKAFVREAIATVAPALQTTEQSASPFPFWPKDPLPKTDSGSS